MARCPRRSMCGVPSRSSLMLVLLLILLLGLLGGCGTSTTTGSSHPSGSTLTPTRELKGTISEFPLPTPNNQLGDITDGTVRPGCDVAKLVHRNYPQRSKRQCNHY